MTRSRNRTDAARVCAVDIGTNSVRTIVADVRPPSVVEVVHCDGLITRLGEGLDASNRLKPGAIERTVDAAARFVRHGRELGATAFKLVATSAARDAENGEELLQALRDATDVETEVVTGRREAQLVLAGVKAGGLLGNADALVVDVGGGSTELIACPHDGPPELRSVNVGAVRLTERFLTSDPPTGEEMHAASCAADEVLRPAIGDAGHASLIGLGGTITTMAAMLQELKEYDPAKVHGYRLTLDETGKLLARAASLPLVERKTLPGLSPARADIIVGGMIVVRAVLRAAKSESMRLSTAGILHGIALAAAGL
jgi:exopolyphosphatase/guanosine-5'-triphosphate,3'-diphosphate pyrophosphatase